MEQRAHFSNKLEDLQLILLRMAALAETAVDKATDAFFSNNADLAEEVICEDVAINELENSIDTFCLELLALGQPMATDLRTIVAAQRIVLNLERLGDEAVNLAERTMFLSTRPPLAYPQEMEKLAEHVKTMLKKVLTSYVEKDADTAATICRMDDRADDLHVQVLRTLVSDMVVQPDIVERGVHASLAARHLERVGDLATNLAECVIFIVKASNIKHQCRG